MVISLNSACRDIAARDRLVAEFLMAWASSRMTACHFTVGEQLTFLLEEGIGGYQQVEFAQFPDVFFPIFAGQEFDIDGRGKPGNLRLPVG